MVDKVEQPYAKYGTFAVVLYHVCAFVTACDGQLVLVFMRAFEVDLGLSPSSLSAFRTAEFVAGTMISPLWGLLIDSFMINHVYPPLLFLGGVVCILLACVSNYPFIIFLRLLHGFAMSSTGPVVHKIITESRSNSEMATFYGFYIACMGAGYLASILCCSKLSLTKVAGYYGWRLCYVVMSLLWFTKCVLVYFYLKPEDESKSNARPTSLSGVKSELKEVLKNVKQVLRIRTFWVLVFVTIATNAPASITVYLMMYFQYCGLSDMMAGIACGVMAVGTFAGSILGGFIADFCQRKSEKYGRLLLGAIVIAIRLIFISLLLAIPIKDSSLQWYNWIELALFGVSALTFANVDRPTLVAVVPRENQALGVALIRVIADLPSWGAYIPLIGFMSEKSFGYVKTSELVEDMDPLIRDGNATALRKSMLYVACFGVLCNLFLYAAVCFTYPDDFEKKKRQDMILENP
ncbi:multiplied multi-transmembrane transporter-like protein [Babesia gibsoni]|uniref:Multiplied multi-transmembrane transporter-like protein n=1 Tax=Babesia gibsoni TaxID=33632 RepID=A0AAD8PFX2_BABGI|nr:multiplied multi-transmembrane transporter-like protein [Babesia gibsoni]